MNDINKHRSKVAYKRLEDGPIDDIDAAVFTGDMFMLEENRVQFRQMMDRWESKLIQLEQIQEQEKCIICDRDAVWVRSTQFAGDHPFCKEHAEQEDGFGVEDSYEYWYEVDKSIE